MNWQMNFLEQYCIENNILPPEDFPWLRYGIEKRLLSIAGIVISLTLASALSDPYTAISFYVSFYYLRSRTNGYHTKAVRSCLLFSILAELTLFIFIYPYLSTFWNTAIVATNIILIYLLAPYNHPNMHLSQAEYRSCRKSSRIRSLGLGAVFIIAQRCKMTPICYGLALGYALTGFLLCLAYVKNSCDERGEKNGN